MSTVKKNKAGAEKNKRNTLNMSACVLRTILLTYLKYSGILTVYNLGINYYLGLGR
jgi:hypothetical protein